MPFTFTTIKFQTLMRAAAVDLLREYGSGAGLRLQVYRARPKSIEPPTAWVEAQPEDIAFTGPKNRQRTVRCSILLLHGLYDWGETVDQRDAFVDGFADYVTDNRGKVDERTVISSLAYEDVPDYEVTWTMDNNGLYYGTRIILEGFASA